MKRHSNSFFLSLFVHLLILLSLFFIYKQFATEKPTKKEQMTCIKLDCLSPEVAPLSPPKEVIKPQKKIETKKVVKKKVEKKKTVVVIKKKKVLKKRVEEKTEPTPIVQKEQVVEKPTVKQKSPSKSTQKPLSKSKKSLTKVKTLSAQEQYLKENLSEIVTLLKENLHYPRRARKRGKEGVVKIKFRLSKNAEISNIQIIESKSEILSRGAIKTLENLSFKLPPPKEELILNVPISYKLR